MLFHNAKKMSEMLTHPVLKETFDTMKEHVAETHLSPDGHGYVVPISFYRNGQVISGDLHVMERMVNGSPRPRLQVIMPVNLVPPGSIQFYPLGDPEPPYGAWTFQKRNGNITAVTLLHDPVENYLTVRETSNTHLTFPPLLDDILNTLVISRPAAEARQKRIRRSKSFWAMQLHVERMQRQARRRNKKWCISKTAKKFKPRSLDAFLNRKTPRTHPLLPPT